MPGFTREGEHLVVEVEHRPQRARATVILTERETPDRPLHVEAFDIADAAARSRFVESCQNGQRAEVERLLMDAAVELTRRRAQEASAPTVEDPPESLDPDPWPDPVDGAALLDEITAWLRHRVWLPRTAAVVCALWTAATWFRPLAYFAPLLLLLSATKRCGKTLLLDLLRCLVRRGVLTSGAGITAAVLFRRNQTEQPTLMIDEAEKLADRHADPALIEMMNLGHRRGASVQRLAEVKGEWVVQEFDAFGFRALAAIGTLWDTVLDRGVRLTMERKPRSAPIARFSAREVVVEGARLAQQLRRWSEDVAGGYVEAEEVAQRPHWMDDRACDNWAPLFAVAALAGGEWPQRALDAARTQQRSTEDEQDRGERLLHDLGRVFVDTGQPEAIRSGDLVAKLNALDDAPWADERRGDGLSTHRLAALLRRFGVRPKQSRDRSGAPLRGYWLADLEPVFERYAVAVDSTEAPDEPPF